MRELCDSISISVLVMSGVVKIIVQLLESNKHKRAAKAIVDSILKTITDVKTSPAPIRPIIKCPKYRRGGFRKPRIPHKPSVARPIDRAQAYQLVM